MSNVQVAKDFFQQHLPPSIQEQLDFNTLELQPGTYIDKTLKHFASDVLYCIHYLNNEDFAYLYVLAEHQSSVDTRMPFRLWQYIISIWNEHFKKHKGNKLPLVIPLVFYNGPKKYDGPKDIRDLIDAPQELIERFLFKPFHLIDTQAIPDEALREKHWSGLMQHVMKHIYEKEALNFIQDLLGLLKRVCQEGGADYGASVLHYFLSQTETAEPGKLLEALETGLTEEDNIMATVVDYLTEKYKDTWFKTGKEEGIQQGMQHGEAHLLISMLKAKFKELPESYLKKIEGTDVETLNQWAINFVNARSLDEVFKS